MGGEGAADGPRPLLVDRPYLPDEPTFRARLDALVQPLQLVELPALDTRCWLLPLSDGAKVFIFEEMLTEQNFACDCCRIVGWQTHPVSTKNWHFIVPAEEGQYSLADPTTLCAIADARSRGLEGSARIALPAQDPDAPHHYQAATFFESKMHRLHGTVHSNGYGHLMRLNGREGGSRRATGRQLMQLWDDLCELLRVREVSTEDVSNKAGLELRVLHTAARRMTWYGQWRYGFGRGGFNMSPEQWQAAIDYVNAAKVEDLHADFDGIDATVVDILQRYREPAAAEPGGCESLGQLLSRMLGLLSHPEPILPAFQAAAAAERERQRMVAEQRMLMAAYHEQLRLLAAQQALHPLSLENGPTAAYFGVSAQQQELQRQQQELFALTCQPMAQQQQQQVAAVPTNGLPAGTAPEPPPQQQQQQQEQQPMDVDSTQPGSTSMGTDPEGEAAAPSGEPELAAAAATEAAAAELADEELALARATAQAAIAAAVQAVDGHPPTQHVLGTSQPTPPPLPLVAAPVAAAAVPAPAEPVPGVPLAAVPVPQLAPQLPAGACLSPPPPPPLPASAAAAAADEVDQWLASYSSDGEGGKEEGEEAGAGGPVEGTLHCRRAAGLGEPPLADAEDPAAGDGAPLAPAEQLAGASRDDGGGGVLRLRGGGSSGSRKRPASAGGGSDGGDAAKRQRQGGGGSGGEAGPELQRLGAEVVGRSVMVYWKEEKTYYTGTITKFLPDSGKHHIEYRDGDKETIDLQQERFKWSERETAHVPGAAVKPPKAPAPRKPKAAAGGQTGQADKKGDQQQKGEHQAGAGAAGKKATGGGGRKGLQKEEEEEGQDEQQAAKKARKQPAKAVKAEEGMGNEAAVAQQGGEKEQEESGADGGGAYRKDPARRGMGPSLENVEMEVYIPEEKQWKRGHSTSYARKRHSFLFVDGSRASLDLLATPFRILDPEAAKKLEAVQAKAAAGAASHPQPGTEPQQEQQQQQQQQQQTEGKQGARGKSRSDPMPEEQPERQQPRRGGASAGASPALSSGQQQREGEQAASGPAPAAPQQQQHKARDIGADARSASERAAEVAARVAATWKHPHIPPPPKPLGGAALRSYIQRQEAALQEQAGSGGEVAAAAAAAEAQAEEQASEPMDEDARAAAAVAAAAVARAVQAHTPPEAQRQPSPSPAPQRAAEGAAPMDAEVPAVAAAAAGPAVEVPTGGLTTEQLAVAGARQPSYKSKEETAAELEEGKVVLGCGSCRYATGGCRRCRPRIVAMLERQGVANERLALLGGCGRCEDPQHGCPVCWRMVVLAGDLPKAAQLMAEAQGAAAAGEAAPDRPAGAKAKRKQQAAEEAAAAGGQEAEQEAVAEPGPKRQQQSKQQRRQQQQQQQQQEEAFDASPAPPEAEPSSPRQGKGKTQQQQQQQHGAAAAAAGATPLSPAAPGAGQDTPASGEQVGTGSGRKQHKGSEGKYQVVDEAMKADVLAARARGEILLGCGRCRYRTGAGCVDCRHKALVQMRQEGLQEGLDAIGCPECEQSDQGCRHCWPAAIEAAQRQRGLLPPEQRVAPPSPGNQQQQEKDKDRGGAAHAKPPASGKPPKPSKVPASPGAPKALKEAAAAAAAAGSPATAAALAAAAAAGAGSSSSRRNKALLAVQREAVTEAHAVGKYALGCGRCRYSMTGGCNNCRAKSAEVLHKHHKEWAKKLGCDHCEGSHDGCTRCWKDLLLAMGPSLAVLQPPAEKVDAAIKFIPSMEDGDEGTPAPLATAQPHAKKAGKQPGEGKAGGDKSSMRLQQQQQQDDAAALAAAAEGGDQLIRFGSRIQNCRIRVWWEADGTFYQGRITSYKQGFHRVLYDEDGKAEKLNLLEHRVQIQLVEGGAWLEYAQGLPVGDAARLGAVALNVAPAAPLLPGEPTEQPLGVAIKDLLMKRVRVLCSDVGQWKEGQVVGYNHSKFAIKFDDGAQGRYYLQHEQWEPLDLELLQQRQHAQRAAAQDRAAAAAAAQAAAAAAAAGPAEAVAPQARRAQRAAATLPPGGYSSFFSEEGEGGEYEYDLPGHGRLVAPPPVAGAAAGQPPPASPLPRSLDELPDPLPLPPEGEKARKAQYKFGLHKYVGQRVRVWSQEVQDWKEGVITSYGQNRHKVHFYDGSRAAFNMQHDAFQLLPQPGSPAGPSALMPPAAAPAAPAGGNAAAAAAAAAGFPGIGAGATRRGGSVVPPKVLKPPPGPPVLPGDALPVFRDRLQDQFALPACTQSFGLDKISNVLRLTLSKLKEYPGQWVPKSYIRQHLQAHGIRDNSLMDYCGKSLDCTTLDGWAVYRNRSPQYNCLYYLAEKVGDESVLTDVGEPLRSESMKRGPRKAAGAGDAYEGALAADGSGAAAAAAAAATSHHYYAAPPPPPRPQRRFAGYNVRRGGGASTPRTAIASSSSGPRRQQPWQMLLPAGVPAGALTPEHCRHQVMADLVYLFNNALRQYKPAAYLAAQQAARAAAAAAGSTDADATPLRTLHLDRLAQEVQVLRDCKHFIKIGSGERLGELPTPPGVLRLLCHIAMPEESPEDESGEGEPSWAPPVRPPPEVLQLPADATVGQLLEAATAAFQASYRMCVGWTADAVVAGLSVTVPPPLPALPGPAAAPAAAVSDAGGLAAMEVDGQPAQGQAAAAAVVEGDGDAMEVDGGEAAAAPAGADSSDAQLAAAVAAAAVAAVVREHDGLAAAAAAGPGGDAAAAAAAAVGQATQKLAAVQLAPPPPPQQQQEAAQQAQQALDPAELALHQQQEQQRAVLLSSRLADLLLPAQQQAQSADSSEPGGVAAAGALQLPSVVVDGCGLDWAVRWRHAGGLEDWQVRCRCGVHDDDGERMIMCDSCNIWQHTRCYHIPDDQPVPEHQFTCDTCVAAKQAQGTLPDAGPLAQLQLQ